MQFPSSAFDILLLRIRAIRTTNTHHILSAHQWESDDDYYHTERSKGVAIREYKRSCQGEYKNI
jgi:hypothetical protein